MKQFILKNKKATLSLIATLLIGGITMSFEDSPFSANKFVVQEDMDLQETIDTVPGKDCCNGSIKMKDFDKLQTQIDKSMLQVSEEMKKIDLSKIQKEIENSLKELDMENIM